MHHAPRDALMVEVEDLFAEVEVLEQRRAAKAHLKRIEIVRDRPANQGRRPAFPLYYKDGRRVTTRP